MHVLDRRPNPQARVFAEAQSLLDDGLDRELVIELYADEGDWLAPLLGQAEMVIGAAHAQEPSWYFEASLKQRFLEAGARKARHAEPRIAPAPSDGWTRVRAGLAGSGVAAGAGLAGIIALGFVTADDAAPGDWNYAFKLGTERLDYRLSDGPSRVSVQLQQTDRRVREIIDLSGKGPVGQAELDRIENEFAKVQKLAEEHPFDPAQQAKVKEAGDAAKRVLADVSENHPELVEQARKTTEVVDDAVAAATGGTVDPIVTPTSPPSPTATQTTTPTPTPTATATATPTEATPTPTETESPTPGDPAATAETTEPAETGEADTPGAGE